MRMKKRSFQTIIIITLLIIALVPATNSYAASRKKATLSKKARTAYIKKVKKIKKSTKKSLSARGFSSAQKYLYEVTYRFMDVDGVILKASCKPLFINTEKERSSAS